MTIKKQRPNPIRAAREALGLSREALAARAGVSCSTLRIAERASYGPAMVKANRKAAAASQARIAASWKPLMDTPLAQVTEAMIEKVIEARKALEDEDEEQLLSNATLRRDWSTFRPLLVMAYEKRIIPEMPVRGIPAPLRGLKEEPARRYLGQDGQEDERKRFFEALDAFESTEPGGAAFLQVACALALNCGMRRGEILKLTDSMLRLNDKANARIELPGEICKGGRGRDLSPNPETIKAIRRWQEVRKSLKVESVTGALFPGEYDWEGRITRREFPRLCREAKIEGLTIKSLRCTFGSLLVQGGTDIFLVSKLMGHADVSITIRHYAYLRKDAGKEQVQAFNPRGM